MPLLGPADPLPARPARVLLAGTSGSGKSTCARAVAAAFALPYVELDALHHGPGWTRRPQFEADVAALAAGPAWVTEYQYAGIRPVLLARADLFVSLEYHRAWVMTRVGRRTVSRSLRRTPLWNGNREPPLRTVLTDPDHIVRWAWRTHADGPGRRSDAARDRPDLPVVVLRSPGETRRWLATLRAGAEPGGPGGRWYRRTRPTNPRGRVRTSRERQAAGAEGATSPEPLRHQDRAEQADVERADA